MDTPIRDVTQVSLDQILAYQQVLQKDKAQSAADPLGLIRDEASAIQKAGELATEILQTEKPEDLPIDWAQIDSPENAWLAARSILKSGV